MTTLDPMNYRILPTVALTSAVAAGAIVLGLDLTVGTGLLRGQALRAATISEYIYTSGAPWFVAAVIALMVTVAAVAACWFGCRRRAAELLAPAAAVIGLAGLLVFPKHNWAVGPSTAGTVHRIATFIAVMAIPLALLLARCLAGLLARVLAAASLAAIAVLLVVGAYASRSGLQWWRVIPLGLAERVVLALEVLALMAAAVRLFLTQRCAAQTAARERADTPMGVRG